MRKAIWMLLSLSLLSMVQAGCGKRVAASKSSEVVVSVGDSVLHLDDVIQEIPRGLSAEDSVALMQSIVESWIRRQVLTDIAERRMGNLDEIDRLVDEYRNNLILTRYIATLDVRQSAAEEKRQIDSYYKVAGDSMRLEEPLVKGIYLKVSEDERNVEKLREWMRRGDAASIENLERQGLRRAMQYEYFVDRWLPWHEISGLIPYRFYDPDAFLRTTKDFETHYEGSVYLLHISAYVGSGDKMPEDYSRTRIAEMLRHSNISELRKKLISALYSREIEEGRLKGGIYDPVTGELKPVKREKRQNDE